MTKTEEQIVAVLKTNNSKTNNEIAEKIGANYETVRKATKKMAAEGILSLKNENKVNVFSLFTKAAPVEDHVSKMAGKITKKIEAKVETSEDKAWTNNPNQHKPIDRTKYQFAGDEHGKGRLVFAAVKEWLKRQPNSTMEQLRNAFPDHLYKKYGVVQTAKHVKDLGLTQRRFFDKREEDIIVLKDGTKVLVCSDWGAGNMEPIFEQMRFLKMEYKVINY
jgi:predicted ArsR family transcriptional regulator